MVVLSLIVAVSLSMRTTYGPARCPPGVPCDAVPLSPDMRGVLPTLIGFGLGGVFIVGGSVIRRRRRPD
jgi:hypothetical protein